LHCRTRTRAPNAYAKPGIQPLRLPVGSARCLPSNIKNPRSLPSAANNLFLINPLINSGLLLFTYPVYHLRDNDKFEQRHDAKNLYSGKIDIDKFCGFSIMQTNVCIANIF